MSTLVALLASVAGADEPDRVRRAQSLFQAGLAHYESGEYEAALEYFEQGYATSPQPLFLYNLALVATKLKQPDKALDYYQRYLQSDPNAPDAAEIRRRIAELKRPAAPPPPAATRE